MSQVNRAIDGVRVSACGWWHHRRIRQPGFVT